MANPDIQALAGIASNGTEICGYVIGVSVLIGAFITGVNGYPGYTKKLIALGLTALLLGGAIPAAVNSLLQDQELLAAVVGWIAFLPLVSACIWAFFLPTIIARRKMHASATPIVVLNLLVFVPLSWHCALLWATTRNRESSSNATSAEIISNELPQTESQQYQVIRDRARKIQKLLEEAGDSASATRIDKMLNVGSTNAAFISALEQLVDRIFLSGNLSNEIGDEMRLLVREIQALKTE